MKIEILPALILSFTMIGAAQPQLPDNVTLQLKTDADQVWVSGQQAEEQIYNSEDLSYPYIAGEKSTYVRGLISYTDFNSLGYREENQAILNMTQNQEGSFLVPFTQGSHLDIEDREEQILEREFLNLPNPSFGFGLPEQGSVKVALKTNYRTHGFNGKEENFLDIAVRNRFDGDNTTDIEFKLR